MNELIEQEEEESIKSHELGNLKEILVNNKFDTSLTDIESELAELDALFTRTKNHTIGMMDDLEGTSATTSRRMNTSAPKKVSPMYITAQMSNLVSLKNLKLSMIKHRSDLQQSRLDRAFKIVNQVAKEEKDATGGKDVPYGAILTYLLGASVKVPVSQGANMLSKSMRDNESDIDAELLEIMSSENIKSLPTVILNDPDEEIAEEDDSELDFKAALIYFDQDEDKLYLATEDYEVIRELTEDDIEIVEHEDGSLTCAKFSLPIIASEVEEE